MQLNLGGATVLVSLNGVTYEGHCRHGLRWHDIHTNFPEHLRRHSNNIKILHYQFGRLNYLY
jgi:hypothetical protein